MAALLLIPFFLIRFGLLSALSRDGLRRAAHYPPVEGWERAALWLYQLSTAALLLLILLSRVKAAPPPSFHGGGLLYAAGLLLLVLSVAAFAAPSEEGFCQSGVYRLSRNPMYAAYFLLFLGCGLLTRSLPLLLCLAVFLTLSLGKCQCPAKMSDCHSAEQDGGQLWNREMREGSE